MNNSNNSFTSQQDSLKVGIDYFLYSCFEFEATSRALPHKVTGDTRWPHALEISEGVVASDIADKSLDDLLDEIVSWYAAKFPLLQNSTSIDLSILPDVVPAMVMMSSDLSLVTKIKNQDGILIFDKASSDNGPLWDHLNAGLRKAFPHLNKYVVRYLQWAFGKERAVEVDMASRPPVGRFAPSFRNRNFGGGNDQRNRSSSRPNSSSNGGGNRDRSDHNDRDRGGDRKSGNRSFNRNERDNNRDNNRHGGDRNRNPKKRDPNLEDESAKIVQEAIENFSQNNELTEYKLAPTNSYYRRLQHKQIKEAGYTSISTGEGNDRAVVIMRPGSRPEGNDEENNND